MNRLDFAPIHGPTPMAPELEPPKSSASLLLGLGQTAIGGFQELIKGLINEQFIRQKY